MRHCAQGGRGKERKRKATTKDPTTISDNAIPHPRNIGEHDQVQPAELMGRMAH